MRNFYKVLGISSMADDRRIKSAFRRRAKAFHPDLNPGDKRAERRFKELMQAYNVLRRAPTRASYDALLAHRRREARWRLASSAAVMAASFVITLGSSYAMLASRGATNPLWDGWGQAVASVRGTEATTSVSAGLAVGATDRHVAAVSVAVAKATPLPLKVAPTAMSMDDTVKASSQQRAVADVSAEWATTTSMWRPAAEPTTQVSASPPTKLAAATHARKRNPAAAESREPAWPSAGLESESSWWAWLVAADETPMMALGATNR